MTDQSHGPLKYWDQVGAYVRYPSVVCDHSEPGGPPDEEYECEIVESGTSPINPDMNLVRYRCPFCRMEYVFDVRIWMLDPKDGHP